MPRTTRRRGNRDNENPVLTPKEDEAQRGTDPPGSFGHVDPPSGDLAPDWKPSGTPDDAEELIKKYGSREHRPRREDVYPYLLIRAFSPGDRGARPTWPPVPCWESPDIGLIDAAWSGPYDTNQLVASPTAGRRYRVFVRVWNLGLLPAMGVHVRAWAVNPGFFGGNPNNPAYQPVPIGGAMVRLEDRTRPGSMAVVELDHTWDIPSTLTGHECLMATASCPLDPWSGVLDANNDRHVGQRNLTILAGAESAKDMLFMLGGAIAKGGTLELVHGGAAVVPMLRGVLGTAKSEFGPATRLRAPGARAFRLGIDIGTGRHLLTMFQVEGGWLLADSARAWALIEKRGLLRGRGYEKDEAAPHPFATPNGSRRLIEKLGPKFYEEIGVIVDGDSGEALLEGLMRLWDLQGLDAVDLARAIAGDKPAAHLLRFAHVDRELQETGGYSLTLLG
ncbi:hypothetical protein [Janibacter sp. HTCC2649]|uniref:hypothetical protein n=1 Tax=Janibacter sp. HTCC2649 TaxID=313589 RepID=UPI000323B411|nr:hypothetical protein [Janibacter sp. HTCC2649]